MYLSYEDIRENYVAEQVLTAWNIPVTSNGLCRCPFHNDNTPSMQVNNNWVYCHACDESWDNFSLVQALLHQAGKEAAAAHVFEWFRTTEFKPPAKTYTAERHQYEGPVAEVLVDYWQQHMTGDLYVQLEQERLITKETARRFRIGWRPDTSSWVVPYIIGDKVDIVRFRTTREEDSAKYFGIKRHNHGSVLNANVLLKELPYVIVLLGTFDPILARQDGVHVVGVTGSTPFKDEDVDRIKDLFKNQYRIIVVPDNTPTEYKGARKLATMLGGCVRYFPVDLPPKTDYISYRKAGHSASEFLEDVAEVVPFQAVEKEVAENVLEYILSGDPHDTLAPYLERAARGLAAQNIAREVALLPRPETKTKKVWGRLVDKLITAKTLEELCAVAKWSYYMEGGW